MNDLPYFSQSQVLLSHLFELTHKTFIGLLKISKAAPKLLGLKSNLFLNILVLLGQSMILDLEPSDNVIFLAVFLFQPGNLCLHILLFLCFLFPQLFFQLLHLLHQRQLPIRHQISEILAQLFLVNLLNLFLNQQLVILNPFYFSVQGSLILLELFNLLIFILEFFLESFNLIVQFFYSFLMLFLLAKSQLQMLRFKRTDLSFQFYIFVLKHHDFSCLQLQFFLQIRTVSLLLCPDVSALMQTPFVRISMNSSLSSSICADRRSVQAALTGRASQFEEKVFLPNEPATDIIDLFGVNGVALLDLEMLFELGLDIFGSSAGSAIIERVGLFSVEPLGRTRFVA